MLGEDAPVAKKSARLCQTKLGRGGKDNVTVRLAQEIRTKIKEGTNERI